MDSPQTIDITVLLTVYKRTEYIREAIESALAQTLTSFEILVVDDSNSPAVRAIVESVPDPRIRYRPNPTNLGVTGSIREALPDCRGRYIAILNDDDAWEPTFLDKLYAPLEADLGRDLSFCDHWCVDDHGTVNEKETTFYNEAGRGDLAPGDVTDLPRLVLLKNGVPLAMGSMFRKSALDPRILVPEVVGAYDYWISCNFAADGRRAFYVKEKLTRYRLHEAMETGRKAPDKRENMVFIFSHFLKGGQFPTMGPVLRWRVSEAYRDVGEDLVDFKRHTEARSRFLLSLRWQPNVSAGKKYLRTFVPRK